MSVRAAPVAPAIGSATGGAVDVAAAPEIVRREEDLAPAGVAVTAPRAASDRDEVRLVWPGRVWRANRVGRSSDQAARRLERARRGASFQVLEQSGDGAHRLLHGDVLELASLLEASGEDGKVDLVYVDPPYASDRDYVAEARLDGPADGRVVRTLAYEDTWNGRTGGLGAYLDMLAPRLDALAGLLGKKGTLWVHVDWRASYFVRAILDEIMGRDAFMNEIVWRRAPNLGRQAASGQFGRTLDTIVVYGKPQAKLVPPTRLEPIEPSAVRWDDQGRPFTSAPRGDYTDRSIAKLDAEGRVHRTASGKVYIKYFLVKNADGVLCRERRVDALWTDIAPLRHAPPSERTGYPTQKPRALLERIIACATPPGGLVVDGFAGSGTTAVAAHALGRRAVLSDLGPLAIATARTRLLREKAGFHVLRGPSARHAGELPVEVRRIASSEEGQTIALLAPEEPLAWSVGSLRDGVFTTLWHAERAPGTKAVAATSEAHVSTHASVWVRVWGNDGSVSTVPVPEQAP